MLEGVCVLPLKGTPPTKFGKPSFLDRFSNFIGGCFFMVIMAWPLVPHTPRSRDSLHNPYSIDEELAPAPLCLGLDSTFI